MEIVRVEHIYG